MTRYRDLPDLYRQCSPDVKAAAATRAPDLFAGLADTPAAGQPSGKRSKYNNTRVQVDGVWFDSQAESDRWQGLLLMQREGTIRCLERQRVFKLHAGITMRIDACYILVQPLPGLYAGLPAGQQIAEDTKGAAPTPDWLNKTKQFRDLYKTDWVLLIYQS